MYVLLKGDEEVYPVYAYRDSRTEAVIPQVHEKMPLPFLHQFLKEPGMQWSFRYIKIVRIGTQGMGADFHICGQLLDFLFQRIKLGSIEEFTESDTQTIAYHFACE